MKIHISIEADTSHDSMTSLRRLCYLFGDEPIPQTNVSFAPEIVALSNTGAEDDAATDDVQPVVETVEPIADEAPTPPLAAEPVKRTRGPNKPKITQTTALETALDALPGVTELTDAPVTEALTEPSEPVTETVETTLEQEVAAIEDKILIIEEPTQEEPGFDLLEDATPILPELPAVETMDIAAAGAEIRRLVIKNTGAWLRDTLTNYKVNRISDLTVEQAHDAIKNGRVRAGEVATV